MTVAKKIVMVSMPMLTTNATRYRGDAESVDCKYRKKKDDQG
jgi:hypothetical protein